MPDLSFAISSGLSVASPTNVETIVTFPPHVLDNDEVPFTGPVTKRAASGNARHVGTITHTWHWDVLSQTDYNALIVAVFGGFTTDHADVTIVTITETGAYGKFNAKVDKPHPKDSRNQGNGLDKRDVVLEFRIISSLGEHTFEFTEEFTL